MMLVVLLRFLENQMDAKLVCTNFLSEDCQMAKKEAVSKDLIFSWLSDDTTVDTLQIPVQNLENWAGVTSPLSSWINDKPLVSFIKYNATPGGYFRGIISDSNISDKIKIPGFSDLKIGLGVMGKFEHDSDNPVNLNTIQCEGT